MYRGPGDGGRSWYRVSVGMPPASDVIKYISNIQNRHDAVGDDDDDIIAVARNQGTDVKDTKDNILRRRKRNLSDDEEPQPKKVKQESGTVRTRSQTAKLGKVDDSGGIETPGSSCQQKQTEFLRCISSVTSNSHDIGLRDLPKEYLPPEKTHCIRDRRLIFGHPGDSGCTLVRAQLVCGGKDIYTAVCANGPFKRDSEKKRKPQMWHAEGHLRYQIMRDAYNISAAVGRLGRKFTCHYKMIMNNSPCRDTCSGAKDAEPKNIPNTVGFLQDTLGKSLTKLNVEIVFAFAFSKRGDEEWKAAIESMIKRTYTVKRCRFDSSWWDELKISIKNKEEVEKAQKKRNTYDADLTKKLQNYGLDVGFDSVPCIRPGN